MRGEDIDMITFADPHFRAASGVMRRSVWRIRERTEILKTAQRIQDGDPDSWTREWLEAAATYQDQGQIRAGDEQLDRDRAAAACYAAALALASHDLDDDRRRRVLARYNACWERILRASGGRRIAMVGTSTPTEVVFFRAADQQPGQSRPTVIVLPGAAGMSSETWGTIGAAAEERGFHWAVVEGAMSLSPSRTVSAVVDAIRALPEVDADCLVAVGIDEGGWTIAASLASEHRLAAAVLAPAVIDLSTPSISALSLHAREALFSGDRDGFEREIHLAEVLSPDVAKLTRRQAEILRLESSTRYDQFRAVRSTRSEITGRDIQTPVLIVDDGEHPWKEQPWDFHSEVESSDYVAVCADRWPEEEDRILNWIETHVQGNQPTSKVSAD